MVEHSTCHLPVIPSPNAAPPDAPGAGSLGPWAVRAWVQPCSAAVGWFSSLWAVASVPSTGAFHGRLGHGSHSVRRNSEEARGRGLTRRSRHPSSPDLGETPSLLPCSVGRGMSPGPAPAKEKDSHAARTPGGGGPGVILEGYLPPQATRKALFSCQSLCP